MTEDIFRYCSIDISSPEELKKLFTHRPNWNEYFMLIAKLASTRSTCLSRPAGAVIVKDKQILATGYNGSMPGVEHCTDEGSCYRRRSGASDEGKYDNCRSIHAEANAIAQAARHGIDIQGSEIYVTMYPCYVCTKLLASAGIKKVYYEYEYKSPNKSRDKLWEEAVVKAGIKKEKVKLSEETLRKTILSLVTATSQRRELKEDGTPTGRIENVNMDSIH
ncbi:MAG: dCMP deaminase family protein [Patescibacteria group bacterium]|nr:dCMP deaminase family protein [Patescibacteria group bacterium]